jgi:hydroxyacylglutathione hydrolase
MSDEHSSSIGRERETNHALRAKLAEFVDESASLTAPKPPTTERVVALNRGPWVGARPSLREIDASDKLLPAESVVLDVRPVDVFAAGHLPGAISVALDGGSFATRAAFVLDPAEPVLLHAQSQAEAGEAARLLQAVGLFEQLGFVRTEGHEQLRTVSVEEVDGGMQMLDVREPSEEPRTEWPAMPYRLLRISPPDLDPSRPVFTICASGARATLAASLLVRQGFDARPVVGGGVADLSRHH